MKLERWENRIHCMDCLEGMKQLPDGCVDLVVTDPPYNCRVFKNDNLPNQEYVEFMARWQKECARITNFPNSFLIYTHRVSWLFNGFNRIEWELFHIGVWNKPLALGTSSIRKYGMLPHWEPIFFLRKHACKKIISPQIWESDVFSINPEKPEGHPTRKPLKLFAKLISKFSNENDLILDPFMGSGTTAVACKQLGRRFIGFEINPDYCKIAEQRLAQEILL